MSIDSEKINILVNFKLFIKPHYILYNIRKGCLAAVNNLAGLACYVKEVLKFIDHIKPSRASTPAVLKPHLTEDGPYRYAAEERSFSFLTNYVKELDSHQAAVFLKFVTEHEVLPTQITNEFISNSLEGIMIPCASTCAQSIEISRCFVSQEKFSKIFHQVLGHKLVERNQCSLIQRSLNTNFSQFFNYRSSPAKTNHTKQLRKCFTFIICASLLKKNKHAKLLFFSLFPVKVFLMVLVNTKLIKNWLI